MNLIKLKLTNIVFKFNKIIYINKNGGYTNDKNLLKYSKELNTMEKNEKNKGVTLITLVITIIVLLILVGVSISTLTGQNGILKRAIEAKNTTEVASEKEGIQMAVTTSQMASANYNVPIVVDTLRRMEPIK